MIYSLPPRYRHLLIFLLIWISSKQECSAQIVSPDSLYQASIKNVINLSQKAAGEQLAIYNGTRKEDYNIRIKGEPYFTSKEWESGSVVYEGVLYQDMFILYDEVKDELVVRHPEKHVPITLSSERVNQFSLSGHTFIYMQPSESLMVPGFYDLIYNKMIQLLVKRKKYIHQEISNELKLEFIAQNHYYLKKAASYYPVRSIKSALNVFADKEKEIKLYIKENNLNFKTDPELTLLKITEYYDELINPL